MSPVLPARPFLFTSTDPPLHACTKLSACVVHASTYREVTRRVDLRRRPEQFAVSMDAGRLKAAFVKAADLLEAWQSHQDAACRLMANASNILQRLPVSPQHTQHHTRLTLNPWRLGCERVGGEIIVARASGHSLGADMFFLPCAVPTLMTVLHAGAEAGQQLQWAV